MENQNLYLIHLCDQLEAAEQMYERLMLNQEYDDADEVQRIIQQLQEEIAWKEKNR